MKVVFCTTCKNRTPHLQRTLPANLADNPDAKFLVLNYNSKDHLDDYLQSERRAIDTGQLVVYRYTTPGPFKMAHAKNLAHRLGMIEGADILVNLDADNFTAPRFAEYLAAQFEADSRIFMWVRTKAIGGTGPRGTSGRIAVTRQAFEIVGGYNERFEDWGPDDKDFNLRLQRLGYRPLEIDPQHALGIIHTDRMRFKEYPHAATPHGEDNVFSAVETWTDTIANFGKLGCGVVYRNFDPQPIELGPLPTRIFGIGMHKTATTSLHRAFQILGYESAHWESPPWAKRIWHEMKRQGRSLTLESHYALCDLPIPLLFRELDAAYPGSKFILTKRKEENWLRSVQNHWKRWRPTWDHQDRFAHEAHVQTYGRREFDAEIFLNRYRRHNAEVAEHFQHRPQDLLVMDMEHAAWFELCGFLRKPVPSVPYPFEYQTKDLNA